MKNGHLVADRRSLGDDPCHLHQLVGVLGAQAADLVLAPSLGCFVKGARGWIQNTTSMHIKCICIHVMLYTVCPRTDTNRQTRTGTNRGVMEPVNENEPQEPNRKCVGTEPKIIVIF